MKKIRGTSLYCGIGVSLSEMKEHIEKAASVGINAVFTSLQLPEADKDELLRDFPKMAEMAHEHGMIVEADIGKKTATKFGIDMYDMAAFKKMGVDYARIDGGYTDEQIVAATYNEDDVVIVLNADLVNEEWLERLVKFGINLEKSVFCHNYYPMRYTGQPAAETIEKNALIHRYGFRVGGFIASQTHRRIGCSLGLPTVEAHREMNVFAAAQEAFMYGMDDLFIGDDLADVNELKTLSEIDDSVVTIRIHPLIEGDIMEWLLGRELEPINNKLEMIIRSHFWFSTYPGNPDNTPSCSRRMGDVTICKSSLLRYSGEIQIARHDLPFDPNIGLIARVIDEDLSLVNSFRFTKKFKLVRA